MPKKKTATKYRPYTLEQLSALHRSSLTGALRQGQIIRDALEEIEFLKRQVKTLERSIKSGNDLVNEFIVAEVERNRVCFVSDMGTSPAEAEARDRRLYDLLKAKFDPEA